MKKMLAAVLALAMVMTASFACAEGAIKIGLIGPMTGPAADYGVSVANGATIAVEEINAKGGIQVELNVQDDEHDPENTELLREHRAKARVAANHLMSLINDVLELNKLDDQNITLAHEAFSLQQMADEILTIGEMRAAEAGVKLIHENCSPNIEVPYVYGSPLHVRQIFLNTTIRAAP